jgi:hypothetical protein
MTDSKIDFPPATTALSGAAEVLLASATAQSELKE